jgi:hypothetical protein
MALPPTPRWTSTDVGGGRACARGAPRGRAPPRARGELGDRRGCRRARRGARARAPAGGRRPAGLGRARRPGGGRRVGGRVGRDDADVRDAQARGGVCMYACEMGAAADALRRPGGEHVLHAAGSSTQQPLSTLRSNTNRPRTGQIIVAFITCPRLSAGTNISAGLNPFVFG